MGASKKLQAKLAKMSTKLGVRYEKLMSRRDMPSVEQLLSKGHDPVHAVYVVIQNLTSLFGDKVIDLPEMKRFANILSHAQDEYMPSSPPISPLTTSYFTTWAYYDLRFDGVDSLGSCLLDAADLIGLPPELREALRNMIESRMGIYEQVARDGRLVRLRELVTGREFTSLNTTKYQGKDGILWYVRLLPPLSHIPETYHIAFTTPYIVAYSIEEWRRFFQRNLPATDRVPAQESLHPFMKYGPDRHYWNEYIFKGYVNYQTEAIFLTGVPDRNATLPHA